MIALLHGLPLITLADGHSFSFQKSWIQNALQTVASKRGYGCWWFAYELAESVELYLRREWNDTTITITELETTIRELLISLRFSDLALNFFLPPPPTRLSLLEVAEEAGDGYELGFFQILKRRLEKVSHSSVQQLEVYGLEASVRHLFHRKRLGRREAKEQIVSYIQQCGTVPTASETKKSSHFFEITIV